MSFPKLPRCVARGLLATVSVLAMSDVSAQATISSGFNLFSTEQDIEIGRRSAVEIERQLPIVHDASVDAYVGAIGRRLAADMAGPTFPYQFEIVNASDINAFALPGGYIYLHRGLLEAATNEGQLAGVLAHQMSHVALRHGTHQASNAYIGEAGLGILGGLLSRDDGSTERVMGAVGGFGLNPFFLKFSRTDEEQADLVSVHALAKAGYDPQDMIDFFEVLRAQASGEDGEFFANHPSPPGRAPGVRSEVAVMTISPASATGSFQGIKAALLAMPPAPSMQALQQSPPGPSPRSADAAPRNRDLGIAPPSSRFRAFEPRNHLFRIEHPSNWQTYESADGLAVTIAPSGGFVDRGGDEKDLIYGVVIRHYAPFLNDKSRTSLATATNDVVRQVIRTNPTLRRVLESQRSDTVQGRSAISLVFWGRSEVTGEDECVTVFAREVSGDHVVYALFIAPGQDYDQIKDTFARMMGSLRVDGVAAHR